MVLPRFIFITIFIFSVFVLMLNASIIILQTFVSFFLVLVLVCQPLKFCKNERNGMKNCIDKRMLYYVMFVLASVHIQIFAQKYMHYYEVYFYYIKHNIHEYSIYLYIAAHTHFLQHMRTLF